MLKLRDNISPRLSWARASFQLPTYFSCQNSKSKFEIRIFVQTSSCIFLIPWRITQQKKQILIFQNISQRIFFSSTLVNPASHKGRNEQTFCPRPHGYGLCQQRLKPWFIVVCRSRSCGTLVGEFCVQALEKSWKCSWGERGDLSQGVILTLLCCSSTAEEPLGHSNEKQRI